MKKVLWSAGLGIAALLVSCSGAANNQQAQTSSGQTVANAPQPSAQPAQPQSFPSPIASPVAVVDVPAVPGLLKPTNPQRRVPTIQAGRQNPFEATATPPLTLPMAARVTPSAARSLPALPSRTFSPSSFPTVPINSKPVALPPLTASANPNLTPLPPIGVTAAPVSRSSLAEAIDVTGVLQIKGKWNVIVKEPDSPTSRYVKAGDYLANGRVLVKRILAGAEPSVILQQNGIEIVKSVGASSGAIAKR